MASACRLLNVATSSGYRESGISVSGLQAPAEKILVAIRTTAIRVDVPLAICDPEKSTIQLFGLTRGFLLSLLSIINDKFAENGTRKIKLVQMFRQTCIAEQPRGSMETKDERRVRKREEGLNLQASKINNQHTEQSDQQLEESPFEDEMALDIYDILHSDRSFPEGEM